MATMVVDEAILDEIVRRLVEKLQPGKIILFGSRARGNPAPGQRRGWNLPTVAWDSDFPRIERFRESLPQY